MVRIIVMGVSGCGKTSFGVALAERLAVPFIEGDALHPAANIAKMSAGIPLDDNDRWPWLDAVGTALADNASAIASCSALKRVYRDRLHRAAGGDVRFVYLSLPRRELERRLAARKGHFMPPGLLDSQLATLESPAGEVRVLVVDGRLPTAEGCDMVTAWLDATETETQT